MRALAVAAALAGLAPPVHADGATPRPQSGDTVGLLDVRVEGLTPEAADQFTTKIEQAIQISGLDVASPAELRAHLVGTSWNSACAVGPCLGELARQTGVRTVIEVALTTNGPSYHYVVSLLDAFSGATVNQVADTCDVCTTEEAFGEAALAVVGLLSGVTDGDQAHRRAPATARPGRRATRWLGAAFLGAAALAGAGSWYFFRDGRDTLGGATGGAAGALGVAGITSLAVSFTF
ncbi:MAG: hypothetical protein R3B06_01895 [Kofleriaceae bacterium]